ncbi:helix-turn-helix domain-containing protein [Chryseobacterium sp. RR2-3-20]|uniref:helix-turn-helix domain-containing protein n=1 Tax=Chryseobacterium sp. RR2-3-20 TaxID=2787626 RepID=UPI001ADF20C1|nr:helix-turn-helix domain-containing protein [Chryseobacterium sp. RR2-3-20]
MQKVSINYKQIFNDILDTKFPYKKDDCLHLLNKEKLSAIDIITINKKIFGQNNENEILNQKHRSYSKSDILKILDYQKKHKFNNSQLALHFKLSRNSVAKWKKMFLL